MSECTSRTWPFSRDINARVDPERIGAGIFAARITRAHFQVFSAASAARIETRLKQPVSA